MRAPDWPTEPYEAGVCFEASVSEDIRDRTRVTIHQRTDRRYMTDDMIETSAPTARSFDAPLPAGPIPGSGEAYETCGEKFPAAQCPSEGCGKIHYYGRTCRNASCPRCWPAWVMDRTQAKLSNVSVYARRRAQSNHHVLRHHITVSFAELAVRFNSQDPLDQAFKVVKRLMHLIGVEAGYIVYHPWRIVKKHRGKVMGESSGSGSMGWANTLNLVSAADGSGWEDVRSKYLTYAPHFHVIGVSEYAMTEVTTNPIEERTGVVVHRITGSDGKSIAEGEEPTAAALAYNFSHAGLIESTDGKTRLPIRAFGPVEVADPMEHVRAETSAACRAIAPTVLGFTPPSGTCSAPVDAANYRPESIEGQLAWAEATDPESANPDPVECGADLVRLTPSRLGRYLSDPEWVSTLPPHRLEALQAAQDDLRTEDIASIDTLMDVAVGD
jgi:hypothetical protein